MSLFDVNSFLDSTTTEAQTKRPPIPAGTIVTATIGTPEMKGGATAKDPNKNWARLDLPLVIDAASNPGLNLPAGQTQITIRYGVMLDLKDDQQSIDWSAGRNGRLRALREATGTNVAGQQFSLRGLEGRTVKAKIKHREYEGELYEDIDGVVKA